MEYLSVQDIVLGTLNTQIYLKFITTLWDIILIFGR